MMKSYKIALMCGLAAGACVAVPAAAQTAEGEAESADTRSARESLALAQTELVRLKIARLKGTMIPREEHLAKLGAVAGMVNRFFDAVKQAVETETRDGGTCALVERIAREKAAELAAKVKP